MLFLNQLVYYFDPKYPGPFVFFELQKKFPKNLVDSPLMSEPDVKPKRHKGANAPRRQAPDKIVGQPNPTKRGLKGSNVATRGKQDITKPLTERQRLFVNYVVRDKLNYSAAARQAGFPNNNAAVRYLLNNAKVQHALAVEREEYARVSGMTKKKVIDGFMEAIDMARLKADPMVMVAGWREVAKMCGFYEPTRHKLEVSVQGEVVIQKLQQLDDAQLLALADGRTDALEGEFTVIEGERG